MKCDFYNFDEVWSKREDVVYNVYKLSIELKVKK
jgi:hypothetical protein